ncbi:unnamed protein product, partial [Didymodactylos carnosus]
MHFSNKLIPFADRCLITTNEFRYLPHSYSNRSYILQ